MKVFLNGRILPAFRARVSVFDHGFLYGDGLYETVRADRYRLRHWPQHYGRLKSSARALRLKCPWTPSYLREAAEKLLRANRRPDASVRITLSRGPGPLGLDPALSPHPTLAMMLHPDRPTDEIQRAGVTIMIPLIRRNHPACLDPAIKSNNAINTILAKAEAVRAGAFEAVLLNLDGFLSEGTTTNLFFVRRRVLHTPALSCGLLEGVTRGEILRLARSSGLDTRQGRCTVRDLSRADEIFLTSTTLEVVPVVKVVWEHGSKGVKAALKDGVTPIRPYAHTPMRRSTLWSGAPGPVTRQLQRAFAREIRR